METVALIRDIVVITFLLVGLLILLILAILAFQVFRQVQKVMKQAQGVIGRGETAIQRAEVAVRSVVDVADSAKAAFVGGFGAASAFRLVRGIFSRNGKEPEGEKVRVTVEEK